MVMFAGPNFRSYPLDQKQRITEKLAAINENLISLRAIQSSRSLSASFVRSLKDEERQYQSLNKEAEILNGPSNAQSKVDVDRLAARVDALYRVTTFRVNYFQQAPSTANGTVGVKAHTLNRAEPVPGYDVKCMLVGEEYQDDPKIEDFGEPSTPTPRKDGKWKPLDAGLYDCWAEDPRDPGKVGRKKECAVGEDGESYSNCYMQIP